MKMLLVSALWAFLTLSTFGVNAQDFRLNCVSADISPCLCTQIPTDWYSSVTCIGNSLTNITESTLSRVFDKIRAANSPRVPFFDFYLHGTSIATFRNSTLFDGIHFMKFDVSKNKLLTELPTLRSVKTLIADDCALTESPTSYTALANYGDTLSSLSLTNNRIGGAIDFTQWASCINLSKLNISGNGIIKISGSPFKVLPNLDDVDLSYNRISILGRDDFNVPTPGFDKVRRYITINLDYNELSDGNMDFAFGSIPRPVLLTLTYNNFVRLRQEVFENFLLASHLNGLRMSGNKFICDPSMRWLRDGVSLYRDRVTEMNCVNDFGRTVYTSDKVLGSNGSPILMGQKMFITVFVALLFCITRALY